MLEESVVRFCLLAYRPTTPFGVRRDDHSSILLLIARGDRLEVLVDPHWREMVQPGDREYFDEILPDMATRARSDAETLFKACSALNVGPLITQKTGMLADEHPLRDAIKQFVAI